MKYTDIRSSGPALLRSLLTGLACALLAGVACAKPNLRFEHVFQYFPDGKRPLGSLPHITRDHQGMMWFAGEKVYRYDGVEVHSYINNKQEFCSPFIRGMVVDHTGVLWVATETGICIYNPKEDRFEPFVLAGSSSPLDLSHTTTVNVSPRNEIYIGMSSRLAVISPDRTTITFYDSPLIDIYDDRNNEFQDIYFESENVAWIGSQKSGVIRFDSSNGSFEHIRNTEENPNVLPSNDARSVVVDPSGFLWVGMQQGGISRMDQKNRQFKHYYQGSAGVAPEDSYVWSLLIDSTGQLWATSNGGGIMGYDQATDSFFHYLHDPYDQDSIASNKTTYLFEDNDKNLWVSLYPEGIDLVNRQHSAIKTYRHSLLSEDSLNSSGILSIFIDRLDRIWIGTEEGLNLFDPAAGKFENYSRPSPSHWHIGSAPVTTINETAAGDLWIGTWGGGLYFVNGDTQQVVHFQARKNDPSTVDASHFWDVLPGETETLFASEGKTGVLVFDHETKTFSRRLFKNGELTLNSQHIYSILKDSRGHHWFGSIGGLYSLNPEGRLSFHSGRTSSKEMISSFRIRSLFEDSTGRIWIGSEDQGIFIYDFQKDIFLPLGQEHDIPSSNVTAIAESRDGHIWLFTRNGLVKVDPDTFSFHVFNDAHGLVSSNFNRGGGLIDRDDMVYAGGADGLSVFRVSDIGMTSTDFPVHITGFKLFNDAVAIGKNNSPLSASILHTDKIHLKHHQNTFTLSFAGLSYPLAHWNQYAYVLENFESDWNLVGNRTAATYTNIPPGRYNFKVKAMNSDGNWSSSTDNLELIIKSPPWRTSWAYLAYFVTAVCLVRFGVRYKINQIEYEKQKALNEEILRLEKERDEMRRNFIADISHELKTPLSILAGELEAIEDGIRPISAQSLASLSHEVHVVNKLVNDLFDLSMSDVGELHYEFQPIDIRDLIAEVLPLMTTKFASKNIDVTSVVDPEPLVINADPLRIHQMLLNILENSWRYTDPGGRVVLRAHRTESSVLMQVSDSEPGIDEKNLNNLFQRFYREEPSRNRASGGTGLGLSICRNIADAHHASIEAKPSVLGGLSLTVEFPRGDLDRHAE